MEKLFAALVEVVALNQPQNDDWWNGYELLVADAVRKAGGTMDDEKLFDDCCDMLDVVINKNALERRAFLLAQCAN